MMPARALPQRSHIAKSSATIIIAPRQQKAPSYKPTGFWYELDGDWRRWCQDDGMAHWIEGHYLHALSLGEERLLVLASARELDDFTTEYGVVPPGRWPVADTDSRHYYIDWQRVAVSFDGIEIAPYIWSRRLDLMWYYGWDCASGCIWQPRGASVSVLSAEPIAVLA